MTFSSYPKGDSLFFGDKFPLDHKIFDYNAKYLDTKIIENVPMYRIGVEHDSIIYASLHIEHCELSFNNTSEFELQGHYPTFPYIPAYQESTFDNYIAQCLEIIKKYPDSRYLIECVAENWTAFRTKESLQKIFAAFSKKTQQSEFGKIIDNYLKYYFTFSNMKLPDCKNGNIEFLIQDSTKMNLIVFSASWCVPCRKEIPLLKEVYNDLKDKLEITYISMDEEKTADNWRKQMKEDSIPWRSLMAEYDIKPVRAKYNPNGAIPFSLLVYPNRTVEIIDIRQADQKVKLYSLCKGLRE